MNVAVKKLTIKNAEKLTVDGVERLLACPALESVNFYVGTDLLFSLAHSCANFSNSKVQT